MRLPTTLRRLAAVLALTAPILLASAKKDEPSIKKTTFDNMPSNYFYFDDSSVILSFDSVDNNIWRSEDDGANWDKVKGVPEGKATDIHEHPFDPKRAYILGAGKTHWKTDDRGKTWQSWEVGAMRSFLQPPFSFHADKHEYVLFNGRKCGGDGDRWGSDCVEAVYYTKNNFDTKPELLLEKTHGCLFARSSKIFNKATQYTIFCVIEGKTSRLPEHRRIVNSDDWFKDGETFLEPKLDGTRTYEGVAGVAVVQKFIVVAVKSAGTDEMGLFISDDSATFKRAQFPHDHGGVKEDAYTVLESTPYSIQVDVLATKPGLRNAVGSLFTSNSDGTQFTRSLDNTNRSPFGLVDFEKIQGIDGIVLANQVKNAEEVKESQFIEKKIVSRISFDDGRTWQPLKADGKDLHLHSVTNMHNGGRVYSSPAAGLVMGVGNTGDHLNAYTEGDLYVSDDAGLTWKMARKEAHKYEFGDGGSILVAVYDEDVTSHVAYSLNHGKNWKELDLGVKVRAKLLTTTPDSTSLKFTLIGTGSREERGKTFIFCIDFTEMHERKCKLDKGNTDKGDFEKWYARLDKYNKPDCIMGHKQFYWRRKKDADCFVDEVFKDPVAEEENCSCTEEDYECDFDFFRSDDGKECKPAKNYVVPDGKCKKPGDKYMGKSGWRKIPGNTCKDGLDKTKEVERSCEEGTKAPTNGKIVARPTEFKGTRKIIEFYYLQRQDSEHGDDETVVMRTDQDEVWISRDGGGKWEHILKGETIVAIYPHKYFPSLVFFITHSKTVHYSANRGETLHKFEAPTKPNQLNLPIMDFHPKKKDSWIWTGAKDCDDVFSKDCHVVTYYTTDRGDDWHPLVSRVRKCEWVPKEGKGDENLILCEKYAKGDGSRDDKLELVASQNFFQDKTTHFKDIIGFATMQEFIIVAAVKEDGKSLKVDASVDGHHFADAKFPHNFKVDHQQAYTVLESNTHSVFLHVTVNTRHDREYGSLIKSNSNGTSYVMSLPGVNRNTKGYVDFEKMQGLEGVAIVNVVDNWEDAANGAQKKLKTKITHNDAAQWKTLDAPEKDSNGKPYSCTGGKCSLNLHGYTERLDPRDTYSSASAVGMMIGVGNVGEYLTSKRDGDTFITRDGGITWKEIKKGNFMWEYGDQGSIIVIVEENKETNKIYYTLDEGEKWEEFQFYDENISVQDITTVPSDSARKFLLWCKPKGHGEKYITIQLDFTGLTDQKCVLSNNAKESDFEIWIPKHPNQGNNCLFGHEEKFYRKIPSHHCYIGKKVPQPLDGKGIYNNCTCDTHDYECDYNYEPQTDGTCRLVKGLQPPDHMEACKADPNLIEWYKPTGYRRIPLTTCVGGTELDKLKPEACPGHEDSFKKKHGGMGGVGIFFLTLSVFVMAGAIGYIIWHRWNGKFGQIRLGDDPRQSAAGKVADQLTEYGVLAISAVVAVVAALPSIVVALYSATVGRFFQRRPRYTTRGSFARGDYAHVANDEGELLGDESDEEV